MSLGLEPTTFRTESPSITTRPGLPLLPNLELVIYLGRKTDERQEGSNFEQTSPARCRPIRKINFLQTGLSFGKKYKLDN